MSGLIKREMTTQLFQEYVHRSLSNHDNNYDKDEEGELRWTGRLVRTGLHGDMCWLNLGLRENWRFWYVTMCGLRWSAAVCGCYCLLTCASTVGESCVATASSGKALETLKTGTSFPGDAGVSPAEAGFPLVSALGPRWVPSGRLGGAA